MGENYLGGGVVSGGGGTAIFFVLGFFKDIVLICTVPKLCDC